MGIQADRLVHCEGEKDSFINKGLVCLSALFLCFQVLAVYR